MTVLEADSDGTKVLGDGFGYGINFVEGCAAPCQSTGNFVNENRASKAAVDRKTSTPRRGIR